mmetsp:Transcript_97979/g.277413  ORF Transcript_97979/g.277413 Transcript_97979/m.277413 type:complete len:222 (-) Transcript_97979:75-740(-)
MAHGLDAVDTVCTLRSSAVRAGGRWHGLQAEPSPGELGLQPHAGGAAARHCCDAARPEALRSRVPRLVKGSLGPARGHALDQCHLGGPLQRRLGPELDQLLVSGRGRLRGLAHGGHGGRRGAARPGAEWGRQGPGLGPAGVAGGQQPRGAAAGHGRGCLHDRGRLYGRLAEGRGGPRGRVRRGEPCGPGARQAGRAEREAGAGGHHDVSGRRGRPTAERPA